MISTFDSGSSVQQQPKLGGIDLRSQKRSVLGGLDALIAVAPDVSVISDEGRTQKDSVFSSNDRAAFTPLITEYFGGNSLYLDEKISPIANLRHALWTAIQSRHAEHVIVDVPSGGSYRLVNSKPVLTAFKAEVKKTFGKLADVDQSWRTEGRGVPALASKSKAADILTVAERFLSDDPPRAAYSRVVQDDGFLVATNGRTMCILPGTDGSEMPKDFPDWKRAISEFVRPSAGKIERSTSPFVRLAVDTANLISQLNQLEGCLSSERLNAIGICAAGGSAALSFKNKVDGFEFTSPGLDEPSPSVFVEFEYLREALVVARRLGCSEMEVGVGTKKDPIIFWFGDRGIAIVMPILL